MQKGMVGLRMPNGLVVEAPPGVWVAALLQALTPQQRTSVANQVTSMMNQKIVPILNKPIPVQSG